MNSRDRNLETGSCGIFRRNRTRKVAMTLVRSSFQLYWKWDLQLRWSGTNKNKAKEKILTWTGGATPGGVGEKRLEAEYDTNLDEILLFVR